MSATPEAQAATEVGMFAAHLAAQEDRLLVTSRIPANAGHTLHRGTPRENLIANFLESHLGSHFAIGTGEVIDSGSKPREPRNQFDIVIYRNNYPKLDFGGGIHGFLVESVVATIEVKSLVDKAGVDQAVGAALALKKLTPRRNRVAAFGWIPPKPVSFLVGFAGPASIDTVTNWHREVRDARGITDPEWTKETRTSIAVPGLDGICILGLGAEYACNTPMIGDVAAIAKRWVWRGNSGALQLLVMWLLQVCSNTEHAFVDAGAYGSGFQGEFYA